MLKKKKNNKKSDKIFCFVCKEHIEVHGATPKERLKNFHSLGHDNRKVDHLLPGLIGKSGEPLG